MRIYVTKYNIDLPRATLQIDLKALRGIFAAIYGNCHKQQMINNDKLNHGKPQLQL